MKKLHLTEKQYKRLQNNLIESTLLMEQSSTEVEDIQTKLNRCFNAGLVVDGKCGPNTKNAIETYLGIKTFPL